MRKKVVRKADSKGLAGQDLLMSATGPQRGIAGIKSGPKKTDILQALGTGALAGLGGNKGIATGLIMTGAKILGDYLKNRKTAAAAPQDAASQIFMKKGGMVKKRKY